MLKRIKFAAVPVEDQERALDFYTKKLGLKIFTDQAMGDSRWIELQVPGAETLLVLFKQADLQPGPVPAVVFVAGDPARLHLDLAGFVSRWIMHQFSVHDRTMSGSARFRVVLAKPA